MAKIDKSFDAVQMMRSIRDALSEQVRDMTFEEEQTWIRQQLRNGVVEGISGHGLEDSVQGRMHRTGQS